MQDFDGRQVIVGEHPLLKEAFGLARRVAQCDVLVNILGETGTGKELLARFIHAESKRRTGPFVAVDCGMLAVETARSELFGHVRGAFTGAHTAHCGLVADANGGTLFLDEVGELSCDLQLQLLRFLQQGEYRPLGSARMQQVSVRVITATHRNLEEMVQAKMFREDLFYRLQVVPIPLPALRDRQTDIPLLAQYFCSRFKHIGQSKTFTAQACAAFKRYHWPGNVRELENEVHRLLLMVDDACIDEPALSERIRCANGELDVYDLPFKEARKATLHHFMRLYLQRKLLQWQGNVTRAAKESGVGRQYFQMRMTECGVRSKTYKERVEK